MNKITRWVAKNALKQTRQKRFRLAAAILAWRRFATAAVALTVTLLFPAPDGQHIAFQIVYVLIAIGYVWMDVHYDSSTLQIRAKTRKLRREHAKLIRQRREKERELDRRL